MKLVIQRVKEACVTSEGEVLGKIGQGFLVLIGVMEGDTPDLCDYLAGKTADLRVFTDKNEVLDIVEKAILLFREQGITGERFADTVARLGFDNVQAQLLSDGLLRRKAENIAAQKHLKGGATC